MDQPLNRIEERVLGCLIEKEMATPEYYPLTLNALVNACNQKSNREPVMALDEGTVEKALYELRVEHKLAIEVTSASNRVPKYKHNMPARWSFSPAQLAILCELLVRGPQTPGDLRSRASRLHPLADAAEVDDLLHGLQQHADGPFVVHLPLEPGKRERRWAQLFAGEPVLETQPAAPLELAAGPTREDRIQTLETEMASLRCELAALKAEFSSFRESFR